MSKKGVPARNKKSRLSLKEKEIIDRRTNKFITDMLHNY